MSQKGKINISEKNDESRSDGIGRSASEDSFDLKRSISPHLPGKGKRSCGHRNDLSYPNMLRDFLRLKIDAEDLRMLQIHSSDI